MTSTKAIVSAAGVVQCWLILLSYSTRPSNGFNTCPSLLALPPRRIQQAYDNTYSSLAMITNRRRRGGSGAGTGAGRSSAPSSNKSPSQSSSGGAGRDYEKQELQASFASDAAASSSRSKASPFRVVLEDESGHVNRELAESIWSWEQDKRRMQHNVPNTDQILPSYSTREGIRLVNDIVTELLEESTSSTVTAKDSDQQRDDLTQEGIIALMHAMTTYHDEFETVEPKSKHAHRRHLLQDHNAFERYARGYITEQLAIALSGNRGSGDDDDALGSGRGQGSRSVSAQKPFLSMESTVGVSDPMEETYHYYTNLDEWEVLSGHVLDTGKGRKGTSPEQQLRSSRRGGSNHNRDDETPLVEEYLDEMIQYEGEDEMWIHQQQVAAPLRDFIPEADDDNTMMDDDLYDRFGGGDSSSSSEPLLTSSSFDDEVLRDMIRFNVDEFLGTTLNETESKVIQLRFGLSSTDEDETRSIIRGSGVIDDQLASATDSFSTSVSPSSSTPLTQHQVAEAMGLPLLQVEALQQRALERLRQAYADRYIAGSGADDEYDVIDDFHYWQEEESA